MSHGKEVAEKVAQRLGYSTLSREVILEASKEFQISQARLDKAIHDAPTIFQRFTNEKQKYIAYVAAEILDHFKNVAMNETQPDTLPTPPCHSIYVWMGKWH